MPATIPTERVDFSSGGIRCAAWLTLPAGAGSTSGRRAGARARRDARHDAGAVRAALRRGGHRDAGVRLPQHRRLRRSIRANTSRCASSATTSLRHSTTSKSRPEVDGGRIGLWGTSLGGMNVVRVAAARDDVAVAVVQCPIVHGPGAARRLGLLAALRLTPAIVEDAVARGLRRGRRYVPIVGPPGSSRWSPSPAPKPAGTPRFRRAGAFDNRIAAADAVAMVTTSALRHARHVDAPLLVCVCDRENLMDPAYAALVARRAPRGVARHYDSDHFAIYHPPLVAGVLADQTAFLQEHLGVRRVSCCGPTTHAFTRWPPGSAPTSGRSQACVTAGPTTTCWRTWSSATAPERAWWRPKCCATVDHSTARTQRWPARWPHRERPPNCSTTSSG